VDPIYETTVQVTGGREGLARSSDGRLEIELSIPKALGGDDGAGTNPEQLFAAGYAACFQTAMRHVAAQQGKEVGETAITSSVRLLPGPDGSFALDVDLQISAGGLSKAEAEELAQTVHGSVCPYSQAIKGNVEVKLEVV
jgi:lipoyl-dependent peroxiredoxin